MKFGINKEMWAQMKQTMIRPFCILMAIYAVAISGILRADFKYIDDLGRVMRGYQGWDNFSRFVSNNFSSLIHTSNYLTDISPLTQWIGVIFMAAASTILLWIFSENKMITKANLLCVLPIGISPYFLECFSYRYDSPYMALSVLASVFPILFWHSHGFLYVAVIMVCMLVMCMTYQAASGIFPILVIFYALLQWSHNGELRKIIRKIFLSAVGYLAGMGYFKFFIMVPITTYVSNEMFPLRELPKGIIKNLISYYQIIRSDFRKEWLVLILLLTVGYLVLFVLDTKQNKGKALLLGIAAVFCGYALAFGMYPALVTPSFAPRGMYGFGALLGIMAVSGSFFHKSCPLKIVSIFLSWNFFVFAFTYGNMLSEQKDYTMMRMELVLSDVNEILAEKETETKIKITGNIGDTPVLRNVPKQDQILRRLIPSTFGGNWIWSETYFFDYTGLKHVRKEDGDELLKMNLPVIKETMFHTIRGEGEYMVIELRD